MKRSSLLFLIGNTSSGRSTFVDMDGNVMRVIGTNRTTYRGFYFDLKDLQ